MFSETQGDERDALFGISWRKLTQIQNAGKINGHRNIYNYIYIYIIYIYIYIATTAVALPLSPDIVEQEHRTHKLEAQQLAAAGSNSSSS